VIDCRDTGIRLCFIFSCDCVFTLTLSQLVGDPTIRAALAWLAQLHGTPTITESPLITFSKRHTVGM